MFKFIGVGVGFIDDAIRWPPMRLINKGELFSGGWGLPGSDSTGCWGKETAEPLYPANTSWSTMILDSWFSQ